MPTSMRRIRLLLALHFSAGASTRAIGQELGIAPSTVREYLARAAAAGIGWPLGADVTDESLMARLFVNAGVRAGARFHAEPDWAALVLELKRPAVNLMILWDEYRAVHPDGYGMKSVFSLAARRTNVAEGGTEVGTRAGELKTYWTKPLPGRGRYGR